MIEDYTSKICDWSKYNQLDKNIELINFQKLCNFHLKFQFNQYLVILHYPVKRMEYTRAIGINTIWYYWDD